MYIYIHTHVTGDLFLTLLGMYQGLELLGHTETLCLTIFQAAVPFYISIINLHSIRDV